jgi:diguanylate cyclase (GGDEF)-like protein
MTQTAYGLNSRKERIKQMEAASRTAKKKHRKAKSELYLYFLTAFIVLVIVFMYMAFTITMYPLNYLWVVAFLMIMIVGFMHGLMAALIGSMFVIFGYGSFILYQLYVVQTISAMDVNDLIWLMAFPIGAVVSGILGREIDSFMQSYQYHKKMVDEFVTVESVTGFLNERQFREELVIEISRSLRYKHSMTLLLMEIAYYSELVKDYGKEAAEKLLKDISEQIEIVLRDVDKKAYLENGIFALILPETSIDHADIVIKRIHDRIKNCRIESSKGKKLIEIQIRYGYSGCPQKYQTAHELLEDANRMLGLYAG